MSYIKINQDKVNPKIAKDLLQLCPFNAFDYQDAYLSINASCKLCKLCINQGPEGVCEWIESKQKTIDKSLYKGICVYIEHHNNVIHPVSFELIGKALELKQVTQEPVMAIVIGCVESKLIDTLRTYGLDAIYIYQHEALRTFDVEQHTRVMEMFHQTFLNNIFLMGGTALGRSFAPRVAARLHTGLTADCTKLELTKEGDLIQIRPAFGGNIMAKIATPHHRPQMATIRYKMFQTATKTKALSPVIYPHLSDIEKESRVQILDIIEQPPVHDISDAEIIIAVGRAFKKQKDLELIEPLKNKLNAELACTRPLIENGWFDPKRQIGLSGRTVKPKLIINIGISGAVQYIEGMKDAELIISINKDPHCRLFDISHYAIVGDFYDIMPDLNKLIDQIKEDMR